MSIIAEKRQMERHARENSVGNLSAAEAAGRGEGEQRSERQDGTFEASWALVPHWPNDGSQHQHSHATSLLHEFTADTPNGATATSLRWLPFHAHLPLELGHVALWEVPHDLPRSQSQFPRACWFPDVEGFAVFGWVGVGSRSLEGVSFWDGVVFFL